MSIDTESLASLMAEELTLAQTIFDLLTREKTALKDNDLPALQALRQQNASHLTELKRVAAQRLQWLRQHDLPHSAASLEHPTLAQAANVHRLWQALEAQYRSNQTLSQQLSEIVLTARQRTLQKLRILRGQQNDPHLYDGNGKASSLGKGQGYIQA